MQADKFKFLSAAARKINYGSFRVQIEQLTVSIQESLAKHADNAYPF